MGEALEGINVLFNRSNFEVWKCGFAEKKEIKNQTERICLFLLLLRSFLEAHPYLIKGIKRDVKRLDKGFIDKEDLKLTLSLCCCKFDDGCRIYRIPDKSLERYGLDFWTKRN